MNCAVSRVVPTAGSRYKHVKSTNESQGTYLDTTHLEIFLCLEALGTLGTAEGSGTGVSNLLVTGETAAGKPSIRTV